MFYRITILSSHQISLFLCGTFVEKLFFKFKALMAVIRRSIFDIRYLLFLRTFLSMRLNFEVGGGKLEIPALPPGTFQPSHPPNLPHFGRAGLKEESRLHICIIWSEAYYTERLASPLGKCEVRVGKKFNYKFLHPFNLLANP